MSAYHVIYRVNGETRRAWLHASSRKQAVQRIAEMWPGAVIDSVTPGPRA